MLTMADKGGRGGQEPPLLADIISEQPLTTGFKKKFSGKLRNPYFCHILSI